VCFRQLAPGLVGADPRATCTARATLRRERQATRGDPTPAPRPSRSDRAGSGCDASGINFGCARPMPSQGGGMLRADRLKENMRGSMGRQ